MANRALRKKKTPPVFALFHDENGDVPVSELDRLVEEFNKVLALLSGGISIGAPTSSASGLAAGALKGQLVEHVFPAAANTIQAIPHGLGVIPSGVWVLLSDRAVSVYNTTMKTGWTDSVIQLYANVASARVLMLVLA